ncbi:MAG TPA: TetR family transcriptional regulator [Rhodospirillaceae bacterium]|nr:TetR family transcriptional regulator [Rhodospirillaceae bacterium]HAT35937.1 TetR family transcriptional regulator [Rhodospirillaceae bacterium]
MSVPENLDQIVIESAFALAIERGWTGFSMDDVATEVATETTLSESAIRAHYPAKALILSAFERHIDAIVLAEDSPFDEFDSPRDRIFEMLMLRFEAMQPYKPALVRIARDLPRDPLSLLANGPTAALSMTKMLNAAGESTRGLMGIAHAHGLLAVWAATARVWLTDENPDLSQTMAALDRNLRRGERLLNGVPKLGPRRPAAFMRTPEPDFQTDS